MTNDELEAVRARAAAAHPGPWTHGNPTSWIWGPSERGGATHVADIRGWGYLTGHGRGALALSEDEALARQRANAAFIAHARTDIPALLDEVERLNTLVSCMADKRSGEVAHLSERVNTLEDRATRAEAHAERLAKSLERALEVMEFAYMNAPEQPVEITEARQALSAYNQRTET